MGQLSKITESDVEQKIVWSLLTNPDFLGIPPGQISTKRFIPQRDIGKGASFVKGFSPDYIVYASRIPCMVVEAKPPNVEIGRAYAEARLYANELNAAYPEGINPIRWVLACNGIWISFGPVDAMPSVTWSIADGLVPGAESAEIAGHVNWPALQTHAQSLSELIERKRYYEAAYYLGGAGRLNIRLGPNSMAESLAPVIRRYFDAETPEAKAEILEKAYVDTESTTRYARTFENFLRDRAIPAGVPSVAELAPQKASEPRFTAALGDYQANLPSTGSIQIIIGAVGSGKSTFVERFEHHLIPPQVKEHLFWVTINFNNAPADPEKLEDWLCSEFVEAFKLRYFTGDPSIQLAVFADRKKEFDFANFLIKESDVHEYNRRFSIELSDWVRDPKLFATSACRYLIGDKRVGVVCVFDNVDRRDRDQQLRIFQIAQWFKSETRSCCVIALRDETYERYKSEPPLDAFLHSNHFYIRAPRFIDVVRKRLQLSLDALDSSLTGSVAGVGRVVISKEKVATFLDTVFRYMFMSSDRKISWITEGLSGRSARSALSMFARLIYSPHMDERHVLRVGRGGADAFIPDRAILNALMKTDYLFFAESHGFVSNILNFDPDTTTSDNLLRSELLLFLVERRKMRGDLQQEGYFFASTLCDRLRQMGYDGRDVLRELEWARSQGLIVADHFGDWAITESDAVKATGAAYVHTNLLMRRVEYVSNCALTMKVFEQSVAERVAAIWNIDRPLTDITFERKREVSQIVRDYLALQIARREAAFPLSKDYALAPKAVLEALDRAIAWQPRARPPLPIK